MRNTMNKAHKKNKVIGVGLNKTGTSTLGIFLKRLDYKHASCHTAALELYKNGQKGLLLEVLNYYDSVEDYPWPLLFKEIYERYPDSKFILTKRLSGEVWYKSLESHIKRVKKTHIKYEPYLIGIGDPLLNKEKYIEFYEKHNEAVVDFFADKKDSLLSVCWEEGDGIPELEQFLGVEKCNFELPHANKANNTILRKNLGRVKGKLKHYLANKEFENVVKTLNKKG